MDSKHSWFWGSEEYKRASKVACKNPGELELWHDLFIRVCEIEKKEGRLIDSSKADSIQSRTSAKNRRVDQIRKKIAYRKHLEKHYHSQKGGDIRRNGGSVLNCKPNDVCDELIKEEGKKIIRQVIADMPSPDQKEVIQLHYLGQLSLDEIAQKMGKSKDAIYKIHERAKKGLKCNPLIQKLRAPE